MNTEAARGDFTHALARELSFLRDLGFEFTGVIEQATPALGAYLQGQYTNARLNRIVNVTYLPRRNKPGALAITEITLVVREPYDQFDYTSTGSMEVCVTDISATDGDLAACFVRHLRTSERALRDKFMAVLAGVAWQSDQLDWGGQK